MFKFLYSYCFALIGLIGAAPDSEGWVALSPVVQKVAPSEESQETDSSIWVIFSKQMDGENFMVRFPQDPTYHRLIGGGVEVVSQGSSGSYIVRVTPAISAAEVSSHIQSELEGEGVFSPEVAQTGQNVWDLSYQKDGKWVSAHLFLTPKYLYEMRTNFDVFSYENHEYFSNSLSVVS